MAAKLGDKECELHGSFPEPLRKVLRGKKLLLWKALLEKYDYDDMGVIPFMLEGVKLVGLHNTPSCYPPMLKPATMVLEDLQKCLDLSKAYKQMAIHPDHRRLAVVFFHDLEGKPKYLVANSLVFGASAAVYSFNRVHRSLWFLLNKMLVIPCGVFYDDFPMFSPASLAENADEAASALLDLLGWLHAKTGTKASPFKPQFQVLGCSLNLEEIATGTLVLENKPGRLDRVVSLLEQRSAGTDQATRSSYPWLDEICLRLFQW